MSNQKDKLKSLKLLPWIDAYQSRKLLYLQEHVGQLQVPLLYFLMRKKRKETQKAMSEQANYLVSEIGKLKGSIVKIGQMMALYGEHFYLKKLHKH